MILDPDAICELCGQNHFLAFQCHMKAVSKTVRHTHNEQSKKALKRWKAYYKKHPKQAELAEIRKVKVEF